MSGARRPGRPRRRFSLRSDAGPRYWREAMPLSVGLLGLPGLTARHSLSYFEGVPPLGLAYIAAATRQAGHRPVVFDALGEGVDRYSVFPTSMGDLLVQGLPLDEI